MAKIKKDRFTFRRRKPETGLAAVGRPHQNVVIKLNGKPVGEIYAPDWRPANRSWTISIMVTRGEGWTWLRLKTKFNSEQDARKFVLDNAAEFLKLGLRIDQDGDLDHD